MLDPQMRRGLLEQCVLAALCRGDAHGYKIIKDLPQGVNLSESTLYPILRRLESAGSLTVRSVEHNGRLRKIYSITETGKSQMCDFIHSWDEVTLMYEFIKESVEHEQK